MARNGYKRLTNARRQAALARLCDGDTVEEAAEHVGCDDGDVYSAINALGWMEPIERARAARMARASRCADDRAAEWSEHDRQEKEAATALQSATIRMIPRQVELVEQLADGDRYRAVRENNMLADTLLKTQKARRIASGRPVERTEVETSDTAADDLRRRFFEALNGRVEVRDQGERPADGSAGVVPGVGVEAEHLAGPGGE